jgi:formamidase
MNHELLCVRQLIALSGTAPSPELLATWNKREGELIDANKDPVMPVAYPPLAKGAHVGQDLSEDVKKRVANEGARTIPGREHGGNCDVSTLLFVTRKVSY